MISFSFQCVFFDKHERSTWRRCRGLCSLITKKNKQEVNIRPIWRVSPSVRPSIHPSIVLGFLSFIAPLSQLWIWSHAVHSRRKKMIIVLFFFLLFSPFLLTWSLGPLASVHQISRPFVCSFAELSLFFFCCFFCLIWAEPSAVLAAAPALLWRWILFSHFAKAYLHIPHVPAARQRVSCFTMPRRPESRLRAFAWQARNFFFLLLFFFPPCFLPTHFSFALMYFL